MKEIKNKSSQDLVLLLGMGLIALGALYCTFFCSFTDSIESIVWILWLVLTLFFGYFTSVGKKVIVFMQESKVELLKVVWPTRQETLQTTSIVMIMVAITGFVLWGTDSVITLIIAKITQLG
jgi:preprotein translocase subunit SecE